MTSLAERANQIRRRLLETALNRKVIQNQKLSLSRPSFIEREATGVIEESQAAPEPKWRAADQELIDWILFEKHLPADPFSFGQGVFIESPQKFYISLKNDIAKGSKACRTIFGALQNDLQKLKSISDQKR